MFRNEKACLKITIYLQGMSNCRTCLRDFSAHTISNHEEKCSDSPPSLKELTALVFQLKRRLDYTESKLDAAEREIKEFKKSPSNESSCEPFTHDYPKLVEQDLMDFLEDGQTIATVLHKYKWPIKVSGKTYSIYDSNDWVVATKVNQKLEFFTEHVRSLLQDIFSVHVQRNNMDVDAEHDKYVANCVKLMGFNVADVKKALKTKPK